MSQNTYTLLDCGDGRRLEAFGPLIVDRPAPDADLPRRDPGRWADAVTYRAGRGWAAAGGGAIRDTSVILELGGVVMTVELAAGGQLGIFPEHVINAEWLSDMIGRRNARDADPPEILNLFAYTGLLSLVAAVAGARVAHVDASRPAVRWARRNAEASGLAGRPFRWLVDDALAFARREARRGRRYAGIILDPPSYGHGGRRGHGGAWRFDAGIDELLRACRAIAEPDAFWLLTTHTPGWGPNRLAATLAGAIGAAARVDPVEGRHLELTAASGAVLGLGSAARCDPMSPNSR